MKQPRRFHVNVAKIGRQNSGYAMFMLVSLLFIYFLHKPERISKEIGFVSDSQTNPR